MDWQEAGREESNTAVEDTTCGVLLQHVSVPIYAIDKEGRCTHMNAAALKLSGYAADEVLGRDMHSLVHVESADGSLSLRSDCPLLRAAVQGMPVCDVQTALWTKSGEPVAVLGSALPLFEGGNAMGAIVTLQNGVSLQHLRERMEQVRKEHVEILRQRDAAARVERDLAEEKALRQRDTVIVTERAAAEQLRTQQRMAEDRLLQSEKLAAVGRLAASISHEINNPLEAITNLLYLVKHDASISKEASTYLEQAEAELGRVSQIVSQTLSFQRSGIFPVEVVPKSLIESVLSLHQGRLLHHRRIRIQHDHREGHTFRCAEGDLRQILNNLVSNAIDAMGKEGGTLTIRTAPAKDVHTGTRGLRISVADTGHGMQSAMAAQIFEPFYTTKGNRGSGLGLWISGTLAKRHGGHLSMRSRMGGGKYGGTTFSLFFPESAAQGAVPDG